MFQYIPFKKQLMRARNEVGLVYEKQEQIGSASSIVFVYLAESGAIDEVTAAEHAAMFLPWEESVFFPKGAIRSFGDCLYRCLQAHTSQSGWTPDKTPSLWVKIGDPSIEFPDWSQPIGAHDTYNKGAKVSCHGKKWISEIDGNVWEPGVYGWREVEE